MHQYWGGPYSVMTWPDYVLARALPSLLTMYWPASSPRCPISPHLTIFPLATSDYPPTFTTISNFTPGHLQSQPHFSHHFQFHTWAPLITPPLSNFILGHLLLSTQFHHHSQFHTWGHPIAHPIAPRLPMSYLGTSHYSPSFPISSDFACG